MSDGTLTLLPPFLPEMQQNPGDSFPFMMSREASLILKTGTV